MQRTILDAASEDRSPDELVRLTGLEASTVRSALTMLELKGLIKRNGTRVRSTIAHKGG
jgi:DNA-binding IclR family transcriptional regulator